MSPTAPASPQTAAQLLSTLERLGPRPVLAWYGEAARIELSGHVVANWVIKSIGHLHDEIALAPDEQVVIDLPPHWKRLTLALACWALGARVTVLEREPGAEPEPPAGDEDPRVVITDRPASALADTADEVLAVEAVSLAPRFGAELPALVHDWLAEVRGSSDRLGVALPPWSGPAPEHPDGPEAGTSPRLGVVALTLSLIAASASLIATVVLALTVGGSEAANGYYFSDIPDWMQTLSIGLLGLQAILTGLGIAGLITGIIAIATARGRTQGVIASAVALLAPFASFAVFAILSVAAA